MARDILKRAALPSGPVTLEADIVLVHLTHNTVSPYVTWQMNIKDGDTYWGHYHQTLEEATAEFYERCKGKQAIEYTDHRPTAGCRVPSG